MNFEIILFYATKPTELPTRVRDLFLDVLYALEQDNFSVLSKLVMDALDALEDLNSIKPVKEFNALSTALVDLMI